MSAVKQTSIEAAKKWLRVNYSSLLGNNPDKYHAMLGLLVDFASDHDPRPTDTSLLKERIHELESAIAKHRDGVQGPDYDYEGDECYKPEAELYRVLKT